MNMREITATLHVGESVKRELILRNHKRNKRDGKNGPQIPNIALNVEPQLQMKEVVGTWYARIVSMSFAGNAKNTGRINSTDVKLHGAGFCFIPLFQSPFHL
jgi:hypothetical protein